jgi:hypothetical protein
MVPAPARDAFQLLDWIMSRHVHEYLDVAGRPVGEGRAAAFRHVSTEMQVCPYAGSRHHHARPMNVSALRHILPVWDEIVTMLSWLAQRHRAGHRRDVTTYDDLSLVVSAGVFLADFLVLRRHRPLRSSGIPLLVSGLYKVCLGFQLATFLGSMRERFGDETAPSHLPDAAGFYAGLEEQELLLGEAEVCSGSAAMIMQAYDAMTGRHQIAPEGLPPTSTGLEIAWDQFDGFTHHAAEIWSELSLYVIRAAQFCPQVQDPSLPPKMRDQLNALLKGRAAELLAEQEGLVVDIARAAAEHCVLPAAWRSQPAEPGVRAGRLAAVVLAWLREVADNDLRTCADVVAGALESQLAAYELYEAAVLAELNRHLSRLMHTLGLDPPVTALTASALSHVCGRTLRDWGEPVPERPEVRR